LGSSFVIARISADRRLEEVGIFGKEGTKSILFGTPFAPARRNILQITHFTPCARLNKML
jgi:hypothetical protein